MSVIAQNLTPTIIPIGDLPAGFHEFQPFEVKDLEVYYTREQISRSLVLRDHALGVRIAVAVGSGSTGNAGVDSLIQLDPLYAISSDSSQSKENTTSEFVYIAAGPAAGEPQTIKEYPTGAAAGSPAKLTTFSYDDPLQPKKATLIEVTDTTV